jgi:hypothetical protein
MENGNFRLFAANEKRKRQTSVCLLPTETEYFMYICCHSNTTYIYKIKGTIYLYLLPFEMENGRPGSFLIPLPFALMQTEVCCLSVCWRRNKRKLSVCTWTKQTKRTCPTMPQREQLSSLVLKLSCLIHNHHSCRLWTLPPHLCLFVPVLCRHGGGWSRKINAWYLYTLMVYL